ncbi:MAG: glycosyltransferase family 4 protein [Chthonomonadaceae bacterium]|nr:glycosyltransferase family 4 protein [Chthonomonadaceae bacterium]
MRVLALRRQTTGSAKTLLDGLVLALDQQGIELVVDDAGDWIPDRTGPSVDKEVSKLVKRAAQGFDMVHAWGYRAAWACSEAFYLRSPWVYTAYDIPKTTRSELIDRLGAAHRGLCSSATVKQVLDEEHTTNLEMIVPGVQAPNEWPTREQAREALGVREDTKLIVAMGQFVMQKGFDPLVEAMATVRSEVHGARLFLSGAGPEPPPVFQDGVDIKGPVPDVWAVLPAADLVVVPSLQAGFSLLGAEAMWTGAPVLFRRAGGLVDMADENINAFFFEHDHELGQKIVDILDMELTVESVARSGQLRSQARFKFERFARETAQVYREVAGA